MEQYSNLKNLENRASLKTSMSRGILILFSFLLIVFACNAQTNTKYDKVLAYSEGIAIVQIGEKYGYIDEAGKEITPVQYDKARAFKGGMARVGLNGKYGFIDKTGREVIPIKYDKTEEFSDKDWVFVLIVDKLGIVGKNGEITAPKYDKYFKPSEEIRIVMQNDKYGYIDEKTGKEITPIKYDEADAIENGIALVKIGDKIGFVGTTGEITAPKYDKVFAPSEGIRLVKQNDKYGYINEDGKEITAIKYADAKEFKEGMAMATLSGAIALSKEIGFIDKTGREVTPFKYNNACNFQEGMAMVGLNGKYGFIDKAGKEIIPLKYLYPEDGTMLAIASMMGEIIELGFKEGLARVKFDDNKFSRGYVFIDKTDKWITELYKEAWDFDEGLARVSNGKFGFIDKTGKEIIPLKYESAGPFKEGLAYVKLNGKYGYIGSAEKHPTI